MREAGQGEVHTHKKKKKKKKNRQKANAGLEFAVLSANLGGVQPYWVRGSSSSLRLREPVATVASCSRNL